MFLIGTFPKTTRSDVIKISCQVIGHGHKRYVFNNLCPIYNRNTCAQQDKIADDPATHGGTFVPIILGSDKTTVSVATGQNDYWPVYLSIGNIHNNIRRAHRKGVELLAFLAIPKGLSLVKHNVILIRKLHSGKEICG